MIVSANLARGAVSMARRKVVVKRLNSVQNFGAMDVLCTDKTGTLTQDKIILEHHLDLTGRKSEDILRLGWLNSFHQSGQKNLIDIAIVARAAELGDRVKPQGYKKIDELPFDFVRRRLSVVVEDARGEHLLICKGAVEEMLSVSTHVQDEDGVRPIDFVARKRLPEQANAYNEDGFRVLVAVAARPMVRRKRTARAGQPPAGSALLPCFAIRFCRQRSTPVTNSSGNAIPDTSTAIRPAMPNASPLCRGCSHARNASPADCAIASRTPTTAPVAASTQTVVAGKRKPGSPGRWSRKR